MFAVQSDVMVETFDADTPGGLRLSMDCRKLSSSATADDMVCVEAAEWIVAKRVRVGEALR